MTIISLHPQTEQAEVPHPLTDMTNLQSARSENLETDPKRNCTEVTEFILMGFAESLEWQLPLFLVFLVIYLITLVGNLGMTALIRMNSRLHTPMYFFLCNLSIIDICYSSSITPRLLMNFLAAGKSVSFSMCFAQLYFFVAWVCSECFLLATMAYDRYIAICSPLLYSSVMSPRVCVPLVAGSYLTGFTNAMITVCFLSRLPYCGSNIVRHFFCDTPPLLALASDSYIAETIISFLAGLTTVGSLLIILLSYIFILTAILKIRSAAGRHKAFSTCSSHLTAVTVFYGTLIFTYLRPNASYSLGRDQVASVFYTVVVPMMNPLIYSLRNKDVKDAFRQSVSTKRLFSQ